MLTLQKHQPVIKKSRKARARHSKMEDLTNQRIIHHKQLVCRWQDERQLQLLIHYHIHKLQNGDENLRQNYMFVREFYQQALNIKIEDTRENLVDLDLDHCKGFSTQTVTGGSDDDLDDISDDVFVSDYGIDSDDALSHVDFDLPGPDTDATTSVGGPPSQGPLIDFNPEQADQEIMQSWGFADKEELEAWLDGISPFDTPPHFTMHEAHQSSGEGDMYDLQGFYIEHGNQNTNTAFDEDGDTIISDFLDNDGDKENVASISQVSPSQTVPAIVDTLSSPIASISTQPSSPHTESSSGMFTTLTQGTGVHPSALNWQAPAPASPSQPSPFGPQPFSYKVKRILRKLGIKVNPATRRTGKKVELSPNQLEEAQEYWDIKIAQSESRPLETEAEETYLDSWNLTNMKFQWQTEGLFLCHLAEIAFQMQFIEARQATQVLILKQRLRSRPRRWNPPLPGPSPLRKEIRP